MAINLIDIGEEPNDGTGDTLRDAGQIINDNFTEVQSSLNAKLPLAGGIMTGLIVSNTTPTLSTHIVNKNYVDNSISNIDTINGGTF